MSAGKGTKVTARSLDDGSEESRVIKDDFIVICDGDAYISHIQASANGTQVVTVKKRDQP